MKKLSKEIEKKGFIIIKNFFTKKEISLFQSLLFDFSRQQVKKITKREFKNINDLVIFLFKNNLLICFKIELLTS